MRIAIIGAGIAGVLPAYFLSKRGHDVSIFEQERYAAMRTSYANGGQVSVSNSEVWTTWANIFKGLKWMLKKDAPLLIHPTLDFDKIKWITKFLANTASRVYKQNTIETIKLGLESRVLYKQIIKDENLEFDQSNSGILHIYKDAKYLDAAFDAQDIYEPHGCEWKMLVNHDDILAIEPNLKDMSGLIGAAWTQDDWVGDIHKFCKHLLDVIRLKYNGCVSFNDSIIDPRTLTDHFDKVIIAAGVESVQLAKEFGESLPIYPVKGYSITIDAQDVASYKAMPKVSLLDDQAKIVSATLGTKLRVAGTAELCGYNRDITRSRIEPLLNWVNENFPNVDTSCYSSWACLRPMTPNMMPIVRESKVKNIYYHTGHGHLGWTISPATALNLVKQLEN